MARSCPTALEIEPKAHYYVVISPAERDLWRSVAGGCRGLADASSDPGVRWLATITSKDPSMQMPTLHSSNTAGCCCRHAPLWPPPSLRSHVTAGLPVHGIAKNGALGRRGGPRAHRCQVPRRRVTGGRHKFPGCTMPARHRRSAQASFDFKSCIERGEKTGSADIQKHNTAGAGAPRLH